MSTEERVTQLEQAFVTVTRLLENHSEQLSTQMDWINQLGSGLSELRAAQAENERRMAQLIDEHIRTDDEFRKLAAAQQRTEDTFKELAASQRSTEDKFKELAASQRSTEDKFKELAAAQQRTEEALRQLAESQRRTDLKVFDTDARLDRLAEIVERRA